MFYDYIRQAAECAVRGSGDLSTLLLARGHSCPQQWAMGMTLQMRTRLLCPVAADRNVRAPARVRTK